MVVKIMKIRQASKYRVVTKNLRKEDLLQLMFRKILIRSGQSYLCDKNKIQELTDFLKSKNYEINLINFRNVYK